MIITGKRKRKLDKKLQVLDNNTQVIPGIIIDSKTSTQVKSIGFTKVLDLGEQVLPNANLGPICRFNSEGKYIKHTDQPMETDYRQVEWTWEQWAGYGTTETHSKIVDVPYKRYPRSYIPPPSIELSITQDSNGQKYLIGPPYQLNFNDPDNLIHTINIFLEIFGFCEILSENLTGFAIQNIKRLNWEILPQGKMPWKKFEKSITPLIKKESEQNQVVLKYRLETIKNFNPKFVAVGKAGFSGYLIFGFPQKNLYVLESLYFGNATYVLEKEWETLSKLTKAEILEESLHKDRIIHRKHWKSRIRSLLS